MFPIITEMNQLTSKEIQKRFKLIKEGTYRKVYDLENGFVIKIANHISVNKREFKLWTKAPEKYKYLLTPSLIDNYSRIIMPKAEKVSFGRGDFNSYFQNLLGRDEYLKFDNDLYQMASELKLFYSDLKLSENWGIIHGQHKIIDYEMMI